MLSGGGGGDREAAPAGSRAEAAAVPGVDAVSWECCCCSRRSGVRLLAGAYLLLAVMSLVMSALVAQWAAQRGEAEAAAAAAAVAAAPDALLRASLRDLRAFHIVFALMSAVQVLANLGLLVGAHRGADRPTSPRPLAQGRPSLIAPWLWTYGATAALLLAAAGFYAVTSLSRPLPLYEVHGFFVFVFLLVVCLPLLYSELAVLTLYRQLRGRASRQFAWEKLAEERKHGGTAAASTAPAPARGYGTPSQSTYL